MVQSGAEFVKIHPDQFLKLVEARGQAAEDYTHGLQYPIVLLLEPSVEGLGEIRLEELIGRLVLRRHTLQDLPAVVIGEPGPILMLGKREIHVIVRTR